MVNFNTKCCHELDHMPLMNQNDNSHDKKIEDLQQKLNELYEFMMLDGMLASTKMPEIKQLLEELKSGNTLLNILNIVKELKTKSNRQEEQLCKIVSFVSKMHQDGEINKDTFNKLDDFLKPYYDTPYQNGDY